MTVPKEYGGHGRSFIERFAVTEELLAGGAPVAAHWIADRQIVPSLLKYGTEAQKREFLPEIAAGRCFFGIGMSEPDSGSDLASVRTKATRVDGGWSLTGTKVWTSGAHHAHAFIVLARNAPVDPAHRHAGLSQFIVRFAGPGVEVRPIISMNGGHHFNEVILDEAFVPDDMVFGEIGDGWRQVTSELSFERSGPERFLSTFTVLAACADEMAAGNTRARRRSRAARRPGRRPAPDVDGGGRRAGTARERGCRRGGGQGTGHHHRGRYRRLRRSADRRPQLGRRRLCTTQLSLPWTSVRGSRCAVEPTKCCAV